MRRGTPEGRRAPPPGSGVAAAAAAPLGHEAVELLAVLGAAELLHERAEGALLLVQRLPLLLEPPKAVLPVPPRLAASTMRRARRSMAPKRPVRVKLQPMSVAPFQSRRARRPSGHHRMKASTVAATGRATGRVQPCPGSAAGVVAREEADITVSM